MRHFSLVSSRNGGLCSHPYLCVHSHLSVVVQSELVSPIHGRAWWLLAAVVPNLYKQQQGERRGENPWNWLERLQQMLSSLCRRVPAVLAWLQERLQHMGVGMQWQVRPVLVVFRAPFSSFILYFFIRMLNSSAVWLTTFLGVVEIKAEV